jgi:hypothetical protein
MFLHEYNLIINTISIVSNFAQISIYSDIFLNICTTMLYRSIEASAETMDTEEAMWTNYILWS